MNPPPIIQGAELLKNSVLEGSKGDVKTERTPKRIPPAMSAIGGFFAMNLKVASQLNPCQLSI